MSLAEETESESDLQRVEPHDEMDTSWSAMCTTLRNRRKKHAANMIFGASARDGGVYCWGVATASGKPVDRLTRSLSQIACDELPASDAEVDWPRVVKDWVESLVKSDSSDAASATAVPSVTSLEHATECVRWASCLPALADTLDAEPWERLLRSLQQYRGRTMQDAENGSPLRLIAVGELGLTLATRLKPLPQCGGLLDSSLDTIKKWNEANADSVSSLIGDAIGTPLVLASLIRVQRLLQWLGKNKRAKQCEAVGGELTSWVAAMTYPKGYAFSGAKLKDLTDDRCENGLLSEAARFDAEGLEAILTAAQGERPEGSRLGWQVSSPDPFLHDPDAKLAIMMPEWDVRRGRAHVDYSGDDVRFEAFAGRRRVVAGELTTEIEFAGRQLEPTGPWGDVCEYSDDDVHYLEIEQSWGSVLLERQFLLIREDRCLLIADALLVNQPHQLQASESEDIQYRLRLPLSDGIAAQPHPDTRELFLADGKKRALLMPLSASEWKTGPTNATVHADDCGVVEVRSQGTGALYVPVWMDPLKRRFKRPRTWRQLTVADQLNIVPRSEAVGYRVQVGSEHWMVYRSLARRSCRTVLGKHFNAGFFCSRFDLGDGGHETLIKVDPDQSASESSDE